MSLRQVSRGAAAFALLLLSSCKNDYRRVGDPPFEPYAPGVWKSPKGKAFPAPESANASWRVMMLQEKPRPKKNPQWKTIAPGQSGFIDMPERSSFRCVYNPVVYRPWEDEHFKGVDRWDVIRGVRCSNDGFRTYSEALHVKTVTGDGKLLSNPEGQGELSLADLIGGKPVRITMIIRPD